MPSPRRRAARSRERIAHTYRPREQHQVSPEGSVTLDLGRAVTISAGQLGSVRAAYHLASEVRVRHGSACLRHKIATQLAADGIPSVHTETGRVIGTRCQHSTCVSCRTWPTDATTISALHDALRRFGSAR